MGSLRRIVGLGDFGIEVRVVQESLNFQLARPMEFAPREPGFKEMSERLYPDLWGYYWGEGARARYQKKHQDPNRYRRPIYEPAQDPKLEEDGLFGPLTEAAVIRFQRRAGLPDDGIVGPETWDCLFPLYTVTILVVRVNTTITVLPGQQPDLPREPAPTRKITFDNVATQMGVQLDKNGASGVFVMQATWKSSRLPDEFLPGHWEHTGGIQIVRPLASDSGKNLQAFYQLTRAEVLDISLSEHMKITADAWVQPFVQKPLDRGSPGKPNLDQKGVNAGGTVQLEIKADEDSPTVKVFVQGGYGVTVDQRGSVDHGAQALAGISVEFDADQLFGGKPAKKSGPRQADEIQANPSYVVLKPGGSANVRITVKNTPQQPAMLEFFGLPPDIPKPITSLNASFNSTSVTLRADPGARPSDSIVTIKYISPETNRVVSTNMEVVVQK